MSNEIAVLYIYAVLMGLLIGKAIIDYYNHYLYLK